jgi:hypothetical protein
MAKLLFVRTAGALGMAALALLFVGLIPFLSADPTAGAGLSARTPTVLVNRAFKGDRLPLPSEINSAVSRNGPVAKKSSQAPDEIPVGCDPAFSAVSSPGLAYYYGRCAT